MVKGLHRANCAYVTPVIPGYAAAPVYLVTPNHKFKSEI